MPVLSIGDGRGGINTLAMTHFIYMSNMDEGMSRLDGFRFYADAKEKLGVPKYEYYIKLEDTDGRALETCRDFLMLEGATEGDREDGLMPCVAGKQPSNAQEVANVERIVLFADAGGTRLARLRVQLWR